MPARKLLRMAAALCFAIFIVGCSGDDTGTGGGTPTPTEGSIGPDGGTLEVTGQLKLIIPPNALVDTVDFTITHNTSPVPPPGSLGMVTNCYKIEPAGTIFSVPVTLRLDYNVSSLNGSDEMSIDIYTNDGSGWDILPTSVDTAHNQVATSISHLSDFAGMADTTTVIAEGTFVKLVVGRNITYMGTTIKIDAFEALIDSAYAPCDPLHPISNALVTCNDDTLIWNESTRLYTYPELPNPSNPLVTLGENYTFDVSLAGAIGSLSRSITFPASEPYITYPVYMDTQSRSGFNVTWANSGSGTVEIILMSGQGEQILFDDAVENNGSYYISGSTLSGLAPGQYAIMLNLYNRETITAAGYDSRSFIAARVQSQTVFFLQ